MADSSPDRSAALTLADGLHDSDLGVDQVYADYIAMGGTLTRIEVERALGGEPCGGHEHNKLAAALNEHFVDAGHDHPVGYDDAPDAGGDTGR